MPSARVLARSLIGVGQQTLQGNPMGAFRHAAEAYGAGRYLATAGGGAAAAEGAEGAAAAAGGAGIGTMLGVAGTAAALGLGYEAYEHPDTAKGIIGAPLTIMEAHKYGPTEEPRQAAAFRAARLLGDTSGMGMIRATSGGRWSNLGIDPNEATQMVAAMREAGGSRYVSNQEAFAGAKIGTLLGLPNEQIAQTGTAARYGASPEEAIRVVAAGVERGNQQGRLPEILQASLGYLKDLSTSAAVSGTTALTAISNISAILAKSGIPGLQGAQGISAIAGIERAHSSDDLFGVGAAGAAFVTMGEANILRGVNADQRFASRTPRDRLALAEQIRQQGFSGPYAAIYGRAIHQEITTAESALGREYGLEAFEEANNFPVGGYRDASGKWVSVNDSVTAMDRAFQSGDFLTASRLQSDLLTHGAGNVSPMERASAGLAMAGAATGEATARTYASGLRLEAAGLGLLRRHVTDKETASALDSLASTLGPSKPGSALSSTTAAVGAVGSYELGGGAAAAAGSALAGPVAEALGAAGTAFGAIGAYGMGGGGAAAAAGSAIAGSSALSGISDDVSGGILLIAGLLERLIAAVERGGGAPGAPSAAPPTPALPSPSRPDKKRISMK